MKRFASSILISLSIALMTAVQHVKSEGNFQVVFYTKNVPDFLLERMVNRTDKTLGYLYQFLENCDWVDPGEVYTGRRRELIAAEEEEEGLSKHDPAPRRRGFAQPDRELQMTSCPRLCLTSGSTLCRSLGCAFCGRCGRRRHRHLLTPKVPPQRNLMNRTTKAPKPTKLPTYRPTNAPTSAKSPKNLKRKKKNKASVPSASSAATSAPTTAEDLALADLLAEDVDEDFESFLRAPGMSAEKIETRLSRHANFYYCTLQNLPDCQIWYKILQMLNNGTVVPLTEYPPELQ